MSDEKGILKTVNDGLEEAHDIGYNHGYKDALEEARVEIKLDNGLVVSGGEGSVIWLEKDGEIEPVPASELERRFNKGIRERQ